MTRYQIVPERSRVDVTARPALPGVRIVVPELSGSVDVPAAGGDPVSGGELTVWLQAIVDDDRQATARATPVPRWLEDGEVAVAAHVASVRCEGDRVEMELRVTLDGRTVPITGAGRLRHPEGPDGPVEAVGSSVVDPRVLGFALPPLVTYALHTRWSVTLGPAAGPGEPTGAPGAEA